MSMVHTSINRSIHNIEHGTHVYQPMETVVTFLWCHSARSPHHGNLLVQLICQRNTIILSRDLEYNGHMLIMHTLLSITRTVTPYHKIMLHTPSPSTPEYTTIHVQLSLHLPFGHGSCEGCMLWTLGLAPLHPRQGALVEGCSVVLSFFHESSLRGPSQ